MKGLVQKPENLVSPLLQPEMIITAFFYLLAINPLAKRRKK